MKNELRFAICAIKKNIKSSAELRTSFLMNIVGMSINNIAFIILWIFFIKSVGTIGGWTASDIIGLQGFVALSYGLVFSMAMGIRRLPDYVASGSFDRFMLSPKKLLLRVATASFNASAIGDVVFGISCLIIYGFLVQTSFFQIIIMLILVFLAALSFFAMAVIVSSVSFFIIDAGSIANSLFELFITPALFHGGAFQGFMRIFFTFLIPSLLIGTLPVEAVKNFSIDKLSLIAILTFVWLFLSFKIFAGAVKKYESSNFMTFGN